MSVWVKQCPWKYPSTEEQQPTNIQLCNDLRYVIPGNTLSLCRAGDVGTVVVGIILNKPSTLQLLAYRSK